MKRNRRYHRTPGTRFEGEMRKVLFFFRARPFRFGKVVARSQEEPMMTGEDRLTDPDLIPTPCAGSSLHGRRARMAARREAMASREAKCVDTKDGVRLDVALISLTVLVAVLGTILLIDRIDVYRLTAGNNVRRGQIQSVSSQIEVLEQEYADAVANTDMIRIAVEQLGMISTKGSNRMYLTVPEDAVQSGLEFSDTTTVTQFAAIQGY